MCIFHMIINFHSHANYTHFLTIGGALGLVLKKWLKVLYLKNGLGIYFYMLIDDK